MSCPQLRDLISQAVESRLYTFEAWDVQGRKDASLGVDLVILAVGRGGKRHDAAAVQSDVFRVVCAAWTGPEDYGWAVTAARRSPSRYWRW